MTNRKALLRVCVLAFALALAGCGLGIQKVAPWQKEKLALSHMAFEPDPLEAKFRNHTYASKEGSSGGYGVGGGGCGCN